MCCSPPFAPPSTNGSTRSGRTCTAGSTARRRSRSKTRSSRAVRSSRSAFAGWASGARDRLRRNHELEARAVVLGAVEEIAAVRTGVRAGDREPEARSGRLRGRVLVPTEALEEVGHEIVGDPGAMVLDADADMVVGLLRSDDDRRFAIAQRISDEVCDDAFERRRIDDDVEGVRHVDLDSVRGFRGGRRDDVLDAASERDSAWFDVDVLRVEPREVEELVDEATHPIRLFVQCVFELLDGLARKIL